LFCTELLEDHGNGESTGDEIEIIVFSACRILVLARC
jgi:hypothetical protein